jgi:hypothetical protein
MQQAQDLIDGLMLFRCSASRRILTSMTLALMYGFLLCGFHSLNFYGKLGRARPVSQAYYKSEKLFFCGDLVVIESPEPSINTPVYQYNPPEPYYPPIVSWSPDGQWLVYHVYNESLKIKQRSRPFSFIQPYSIFKVNVATGNETKIIDGGMYPYWRWPIESQK